jgi:myo-inositol-1(or 4)-monophosphatase
MNLDDRHHYLRIAVAAAKAAGDVICSFYQSAYDAWDKKPDNPITTADLAADTLLRERLTAATPDFGWLSEETRDTPERLERRYLWVVDPLDGTKEFIEGLDQFAVSVALVGDHQPLLGVIHNPATGEMIAGIVGEGLTCNGEPARPLSGRTEARGAQVLASNTEVRRGMWDPYLEIFDVVEVGSAAYKLGRIAAGLSDAYISLNPKNEWDICGGVALILAAGGRVTDLRGKTFRFNQAKTLVDGLVAANPALHGALLKALERTR